MNILKLTLCHNDHISQFILDDFCCNRDYVQIFYGRESNEIIHHLITNGEWRITIGIVLTLGGMVKVITQQISALYRTCLDFIEQCFNLFCCCMNK